MSRFDFSEFVEQRNEANLRREKAERDKQEQARQTWVELTREAGNYVHRNGRRCELSSEYPSLVLNAGRGLILIVTVKSCSSFVIEYPGIRDAGYLETDDKVQELTNDKDLMQGIVDWYEALPRSAT